MDETNQPSFWKQNELTIKGVLIGILIMILLIPTLFLHSLVEERSMRQNEVVEEVNSKWAGRQVITGPFLMVPYLVTQTIPNKESETIRKWACFLPDQLSIKGKLDPVERYRSIFKITLFQTALHMEGDFSINFPERESVQWLPEEAWICTGLSDFRGIEDTMQINWNGESLAMNAGLPDNLVLNNGLSTPVKIENLSPGQSFHFAMNFRLKGSGNLSFIPVGKTTTVELNSAWSNPSFDGSFLPETREISGKGFQASWKVLYLNRSYPQAWMNEKFDLKDSGFGVSLLQSTDGYAKTSRSIKYAILFIGLTFTLYFFIEILQKKRIHPLQYILVGLALCVFYSLLLSISEYLGFNLAYLIASIATVSMITGYTYSIFKTGRVAWIFGTAMASLYGFIFVLIQLQDGALLVGSIGLFTILALVMYYSRKIDWYGSQGSLKTGLSI